MNLYLLCIEYDELFYKCVMLLVNIIYKKEQVMEENGYKYFIIIIFNGKW